MELNCPHCGARIRAEDINIQKMVAVCHQCDHIFDFSHLGFGRKKKRRPPPAPKRLRVQDDEEQLTLSYRMALGIAPRIGLGATLFGAIVPLLLLFFITPNDPSPPPPLFLLFWSLICWYAVAMFVTTTTRITLDEDTLDIKDGPLPFPISDDKTLNLADITRIFHDESTESWPPGVTAHHVRAELTTGARITLVSHLPRDYAAYIAWALDDGLQSETESAAITPGDEFQAEVSPDEAAATASRIDDEEESARAARR